MIATLATVTVVGVIPGCAAPAATPVVAEPAVVVAPSVVGAVDAAVELGEELAVFPLLPHPATATAAAAAMTPTRQPPERLDRARVEPAANGLADIVREPSGSDITLCGPFKCDDGEPDRTGTVERLLS